LDSGASLSRDHFVAVEEFVDCFVSTSGLTIEFEASAGCDKKTQEPLRQCSAIIMERGNCSLEEYLHTERKNRRLNYTKNLELSTKVLEIVQALHDMGLTWLDIKPSNFVLFAAGGGVTIKGVDLESAVRLSKIPSPASRRRSRPTSGSGALTTAILTKATPSFMSPEMAASALRNAAAISAAAGQASTPNALPPIDTPFEDPLDNLKAVDVWAAGVTLWIIFDADGFDLMRRAFPLTGDEPDLVMAKLASLKQHDLAGLPRKHFGSNYVPWQAVVVEMLRRAPNDRPSAEQLLRKSAFTGSTPSMIVSVGGSGAAADHMDAKFNQIMLHMDAKLGMLKSTLQKTMFNLSERTYPTTFIIIEADVVESENTEDVKRGAIQRMKALMTAMVNSGSTMKEAIEACLQSKYYLSLVCEGCGTPQKPYYTVTQPKEIVGKIMPLLRVGFFAVCLTNTVSSVGRAFGLPTPTAGDSTIQNAAEYIERQTSSSLEEYTELQKAIKEAYSEKTGSVVPDSVSAAVGVSAIANAAASAIASASGGASASAKSGGAASASAGAASGSIDLSDDPLTTTVNAVGASPTPNPNPPSSKPASNKAGHPIVQLETGYCAREFYNFLQGVDPDENWRNILSRWTSPDGDVLFYCRHCCDRLRGTASDK
jgi:serine/threonine protein kinase